MKLIHLMGFALLTAASGLASNSEQRIDHTASAFQEIMRTPDKGIPRDLLERASCIIIIPGMKKGAFAFGGKYGRGTRCNLLIHDDIVDHSDKRRSRPTLHRYFSEDHGTRSLRHLAIIK